MPRVLVTGGAGFIGSCIVSKFLYEDFDVDVWDNLSTGLDENVPDHPRVNFPSVDVRQLEEFLDECPPDVVVHCAAPIKDKNDPATEMSTVVGGTVALASRFPEARFILISSLTDMFSEEQHLGVVTDNTEPQPISTSALAKLLSEVSLLKLHKNWVSLRVSEVYGPGKNTGVISVFMENLRKDLDLKIPGSGKQIRDYIHVEDIAQAVFIAATKDKAINSFLHICSGQSLSLNDLMLMFKTHNLGPRVTYEDGDYELRNGNFPPPERARSILKGWDIRKDVQTFIGEEIKGWTER